MLTLAILCTPLCATVALAIPEERTRQVLAYELHVDATDEELDELEAVLEQSHARFAELFRAKPKVRKDQVVGVHLMQDKAAWENRIRRGGNEVPGGVDYVYYDPEVDAVYLYRQASTYQTRAFLIHGLCQQFHCKAKPKNRDLVRTWLAMGVSDHLALHKWDGETLELGALPLVGTHDPLAVARETLDPDRFDPSKLFDEGIQDASVCFALVRYLTEHAPAKQQKRFYKLGLGYTGSKLEPRTYAKSLGNPKKITGQLLEFLESHQHPMKAESGVWEDRGSGVLRAQSAGGASFAMLKAPAQSFTVLVHTDPRGAVGGVVFGAADPEAGLRVEVYADELVVRGRDGDGNDVLEPVSLAATDEGQGVQLLFTARESGTTLTVNGEVIETYATREPRFGLYVEGGTVLFDSPTWE